ncbi:glutamate synthase large subunit [Thioalkalivibrio sp. HK1]|uniref:glutamate synthase large subunit n=1 Tax=Thioalkalivibrio sp. HK1 TaxID=1469245 RepID=UPI0009DD537C|nr:glutamate synthase large subunit [Thioalkalivibrio sp. HK1]
MSPKIVPQRISAIPRARRPERQGLYDPAQEKDSCGVGFVCDIHGRSSRRIIEHAKQMNCSMVHRGGIGYESNTGDGTGILTAIPHDFLVRKAKESLGVDLPRAGRYGVGLVFLPHEETAARRCKEVFERCTAEAGQAIIGWRPLPIDPDAADIGGAARAAMPRIEQLFIAAADGIEDKAFERSLYLIRKHATHLAHATPVASDPSDHRDSDSTFYVVSLSAGIIVYKGMLTPPQLFAFYPDLDDPEFASHLAMVHSRFSTNTFPSWDRAQPNRLMSHNGEINTLLGNRNWMNARQGVLESDLFEEDLSRLFPVVEPDCSDSGTFDNVLEFLLMTGRSLPEAVLMMIPEAWQQDASMSADKRAFYEYHSCLMEPWDGPASIAFTDGAYIGAVLDRNGLRPSRYSITDDGLCVMASEVGVVDIDPARVIEKGRLQPGRMFLIDFKAGRMIPDHEIKSEVAQRHPFGAWLERQRIEVADLPLPSDVPGLDSDRLMARMQAFGYTAETMQFMLLPLVRELRDPLGSMGNDSALAVMSERPRMLYDYFRQLFAQVTNPAIDSIREEVVMALECFIGPERNLLDPGEVHAHRLHLPHPILSNEDLAALARIDRPGWRAHTIDITFPRDSGRAGLVEALDRICRKASAAVAEKAALIILSDRSIAPDRVPISALAAVGAVHHHLVHTRERTRVGLIVETGEAREVHHHCLLVGYGADAINPWLAFEALWDARRKGHTADADALDDDAKITAAYRKAVAKGMLKVMAKMGISTLQSYKGAQIFEIVGLADEVVDRCFSGTASRVQGLGFDQLAEEMQRRHASGFPAGPGAALPVLSNPGDFHWRRHGEIHLWDPDSIAHLQVAARSDDEEAYWRFARHANEQTTRHATLRGLLRFRSSTSPVPLSEVEPASEIVRRFATGAMSFGSLSSEAHETLAIAMNRIGGKSNTGEGGEDPARSEVDPNGDSRRSAIKQVASGRFGVTIEYLAAADEIQIKIVQGAKPGEGGELPGGKVDDYIAWLRHSTPGVGLISPPPHHDIYSIEDIAQLIHDLKNANPDARISVKLGSEVGVGTVAAGVVKARADHLVIAGDSGGTGASPLTSIKHAGLPWELGIAETHQVLVMNNLRSRVTLQTDGQLKTGRDVAIAALLGAEEFGFSTAPLITLGCIMMRKCHLNTCPVGIATQNPALRKKFSGAPEHVINYLFMVAEELRRIMADLGLRKVDEMIGRVDLLSAEESDHWKAKGIDLSAIITPVRKPVDCLGVHHIHDQDHGLEGALDHRLIELAEPALATGEKVVHELPIRNTDRVVGTMLSHRLVRRRGSKALPDDTLRFRFTGSAGQSFGAFLAPGITLEIEGDANDYVGKGLSGGRIIVYPPKASPFAAEKQILIGNVVLYGATAGECFFRGIAAERFGVRNSGATAVVEGVGDHGCEYMTGGRVLILGPTGRNFAAGMSGGIAYVLDVDGRFGSRCNLDMVDLEEVVEESEIAWLRDRIERHRVATGSEVARTLLEDWPQSLARIVKVMPVDYRRALEASKERDMKGIRQSCNDEALSVGDDAAEARQQVAAGG